MKKLIYWVSLLTMLAVHWNCERIVVDHYCPVETKAVGDAQTTLNNYIQDQRGILAAFADARANYNRAVAARVAAENTLANAHNVTEQAIAFQNLEKAKAAEEQARQARDQAEENYNDSVMKRTELENALEQAQSALEECKNNSH